MVDMIEDVAMKFANAMKHRLSYLSVNIESNVKRIQVKLIGGLGNQLFQYAVAYALSRRINAEINLDISEYKRYKLRRCVVDMLPISDILSGVCAESPGVVDNFFEISYKVLQKIVKLTGAGGKSGKFLFDFYSRFGRHYNFDNYYYDINNIRSNNKLYGYYQSERYFKYYSAELKELLTPQLNSESRKKIDRYISNVDIYETIAVSVRCGEDYKRCGLYKCDQSYFERALKFASEKVRINKIFVFSDDLITAKKDFKFNGDVIYVEDLDEFESLYLMSKFRNFILANSSFSWWGAYLSRAENKLVIAPTDWYNLGKNIDDIYWDECVVI